MRATEFIAEIEAFKGSDYIGGNIPFVSNVKVRVNPDLTKKILSSAKNLPNSNFKYNFITDPYEIDIKIVYLIAPDNQIVGALQLNDLYDNMFEVNKIDVLPEWRNQGVAKGLYGVVLAVMKKVLISGKEQTEAGARNWLSLSKIPGVEIVGRLIIDKRYTEEIISQLNNMNAKHVDRGPWFDYFHFPVKPDTSLPRLKASFENEIKLYHGRDDYKKLNLEISLMAVYRGTKLAKQQ
jgi:hypothetical protein